MKTLYLIRHTAPKTARGICYGQLDVPVAESFAMDAAQVCAWLPPVDCIITSPLQRCRALADHLALHQGCPVRTDARLQEMHFGDWEGRTWDDIPRNEIDAWAADTLLYAPPNGESAQQMMRRVASFLHDIAHLPQQHIAIVAHGGSIRAMLATVANIVLADTLAWQIEYGAVIGAKLPG